MINFRQKSGLALMDRHKPLNKIPDCFIDSSTSLVSIFPVDREYDGKYNKCILIYITKHPEKGYFELIKDLEDNNYYSCHFKTQTSEGLGSEKGYSTKALTTDEKESMFSVLINAIPSGGMLSCYGHLSPGGIHAIEKMGERSKGLLIKCGTREVLDYNYNKVKIPIWKKK